MPRNLALLVLLAFAGLTACDSAKSSPVPPPDAKADLDQFRDFVREHPRVLEELQKDPTLIGTKTFAEEHRAVADYLREHPAIPEELKKYPHFFDGLTATRQAGQGKGSQPGGSR